MRLTSMLLLFFIWTSVTGRSIIATASGKWSDKKIWSCKCVPGGSDDIAIPKGIKVVSLSPILLNGAPRIVLQVDGILELIGGAVHIDADDSIVVGEGGQILTNRYSEALYSGIIPFFVSDQKPLSGPVTLTSGSPSSTLLFFKGEKKGSQIVVQWATATSARGDRFQLQRSADGIHFETVTEIEEDKESGDKVDCSWSDAHPLRGLAYYRLHLDSQSDRSGTATISVTGEGTRRKSY